MFRRLTFGYGNVAGRAFFSAGNNPSKYGFLKQKTDSIVSIATRNFRLSAPVKVNPLIWMILRPISRVGAMIFGRSFRKWWFNLPPDRQRRFYEKFMTNRPKLLGTIAN